MWARFHSVSHIQIGEADADAIECYRNIRLIVKIYGNSADKEDRRMLVYFESTPGDCLARWMRLWSLRWLSGGAHTSSRTVWLDCHLHPAAGRMNEQQAVSWSSAGGALREEHYARRVRTAASRGFMIEN